MSNYDRIPRDMREYKQWIVWRYEDDIKVPYNARLLTQRASVTDESTWCDFETARRLCESDDQYGLGFVLTKNDPFLFIDLDAIKPTDTHIDRETASKIGEWQKFIFEKMDTYAEFSPSGKGVHLIVRASVPQGRKRQKVEVYSDLRFMTMTGDVINDRPIEPRQGLVDILYEKMAAHTRTGNGAGNAYHVFDTAQTASDQQIIEMGINAANGQKFRELMAGRWEGMYPSQSEADLALIDMLVFYTQNKDQVRRIFHTSMLGVRRKAFRVGYFDTMHNLAYDRMYWAKDIEAYKADLDATIQKKSAADSAKLANGANGASGAESLTPDLDALARNPFTVKVELLPDGLAKDLAIFMYDQSPRPVREISLAASLGLLAGICGRAFNTPTGAGLNLYILLLARTGTGKEAMSEGITKLMKEIRREIPGAEEFLGPGEFRSDAALYKTLSRQPSMISVQKEFGHKLKQMSDQHANAAMKGLQGAMLDAFSSSGYGGVLRSIAYSDKDKNTLEIDRPALSLLCESTPGIVYESIDADMVTGGLLPRFMIVHYDGMRVGSNPNSKSVKPTLQLLHKLKELIGICLHIQAQNQIRYVGYESQEVYELSSKFDRACDAKINKEDNEIVRDLWNRAHLKALKLSSLIAVSQNPHDPRITKEAWEWAQAGVIEDTERLLEQFKTGNVGSKMHANEHRQCAEVMRVIKEYLTRPFNEVKSYDDQVSEFMHADKIVPAQYILKRCFRLRCFTEDRGGAAQTINRTINVLCETGNIEQLPREQMMQRYRYSRKAYIVLNFEYK